MSTYLASFFGIDSYGSARMEVMTSSDAQNFKSFNWYLSDIVRDPSIMFDGTYFWMVCTGSNSNSFPLYKSTGPGQSWTKVMDVSTATLPSGTAYYTWAPEWFIDDDSSIHIVVAVNTVNSLIGPAFQPYELHPTNVGMTTWSNPAAMPFTGVNAPSSAYDYFIVSPNNSPTGNYALFYSTVRSSVNYIEYATASTLTGSYTVQQHDNWAGWGGGFEGPCLLKVGSNWYMYFDQSGGNLSTGQIQFSTSPTSSNWGTASWSTPVNIAQDVAQTKQGTVISIPFILPSLPISSGGVVGEPYVNQGVSNSSFNVNPTAQLGFARFGDIRLGIGPLVSNPNISISISDTLTFLDSVGTGNNQSTSDTITFSDSLVVISDCKVNLNDTLNLSDSSKDTLNDLINLSDTINFLDTAQVALGLDYLFNDIITFTDALGQTGGSIDISVSDTISFTDPFTGTPLVVADPGLTFTDSVALSGTNNLVRGDLISFVDSIAITLLDILNGIYLSLGDTLSFLDSLVVVAPIPVSANDSLSLSDTANDFSSCNEFASDTVSFTDSVLVVFIRSLLIIDSLAFSDFVNLNNQTVGEAAADNISLSDAVALFMPLLLLINDTIAFVDSVAVNNANVIEESVADSLSFSDSVEIASNYPDNYYLRRYLNDVYWRTNTKSALTVQISDTITFSDSVVHN